MRRYGVCLGMSISSMRVCSGGRRPEDFGVHKYSLFTVFHALLSVFTSEDGSKSFPAASSYIPGKFNGYKCSYGKHSNNLNSLDFYAKL